LAKSGQEIIETLRSELASVNKAILEHPLLKEAEEGRLPLEVIRRFVANQLYIVPHDLRSLSVLLSRSRDEVEARFFKALVDGDYKALQLLHQLAGELGLSSYTSYLLPAAVAYTHYLAWLALYASPGEAAVALVINLPVWGSSVGRLARALKSRYGLRRVDFLEFFERPYNDLEEMAYPIIERYANLERYRLVAKMIQAYERMFWDSIYRGG